jgi:hypothetical protein
MKNPILLAMASLMLLSSCEKSAEALIEKVTPSNNSVTANGFTKYTIKKGQHYADGNAYKTIEATEMKFVVKFDSTAIYKTIAPANQYDINKLYGFSDNNADHHQYSARFGWRWSNNALRLFAYIYNNGSVLSKELKTINIGEEVTCKIQVTNTSYLFSINDITERFPRMATTPKAKGYQLYPYFGGDEVAPHDVNVYLKAL